MDRDADPALRAKRGAPLRPNATFDHVYAIVRVDRYSADAVPTITVKQIVWSQEAAEQEVERLNVLNRPKGAGYFWQVTRLERRVAGRDTGKKQTSMRTQAAQPLVTSTFPPGSF